MRARLLPKALAFRGLRLERFELDGCVWFLAAQLRQAMLLQPHYLMSVNPRLYTPEMTRLAWLEVAPSHRGPRPSRHKRRLFSVAGAQLLAGAASSPEATQLCELMSHTKAAAARRRR